MSRMSRRETRSYGVALRRAEEGLCTAKALCHPAAVQMHPDQLTVSPPMVGTLIAEQFPQWTDLPIQSVSGAGTVNAIFRVGEHVVARFPLEPSDDAARRLISSLDEWT